jgi:hypothetical protein
LFKFKTKGGYVLKGSERTKNDGTLGIKTGKVELKGINGVDFNDE